MWPRKSDWEELIAVFRVEARRACASGPVGPHSEDDLVQLLLERLLGSERRVLERFDPTRGRGGLRAYFRTYARHRIEDQRRKYANRARRDEEYQSSVEVSLAACPGAHFEANELAQHLQHCLAKLRARSREVYLLSQVTGLSPREISNLLSVHVSTVSRIKSEVLASLSACISRLRSMGPRES